MNDSNPAYRHYNKSDLDKSRTPAASTLVREPNERSPQSHLEEYLQ